MANNKPSGIIYLWYLRPSGRRTYADVDTGWWLADLPADSSRGTPFLSGPGLSSQAPLHLSSLRHFLPPPHATWHPLLTSASTIMLFGVMAPGKRQFHAVNVGRWVPDIEVTL